MTQNTTPTQTTRSAAENAALTPFIAENHGCLMSFLQAAAFSGVFLMGDRRKCACTFIELSDNDKSPAVEPNWQALAALVIDGNTLCVQVDMRKLPLVCAHLQEKGAAAGVSATVFYHKKSPLLKYCSGTLHEIAGTARRSGADSSVLLMVGPAACSSAWKKEDTLFTKNIAIACVEDKQDALIEELQHKNASVFKVSVASFLSERGKDEYKIKDLSKTQIKAEEKIAETFCDALQDEAIDMLILPDAQLAHAVFKLLEANFGSDIKSIFKQVKIVACGVIAGSVVEQYSLEAAIQTDSYMPSKIVAAILESV